VLELRSKFHAEYRFVEAKKRFQLRSCLHLGKRDISAPRFLTNSGTVHRHAKQLEMPDTRCLGPGIEIASDYFVEDRADGSPLTAKVNPRFKVGSSHVYSANVESCR